MFLITEKLEPMVNPPLITKSLKEHNIFKKRKEKKGKCVVLLIGGRCMVTLHGVKAQTLLDSGAQVSLVRKS